MQYSLFPDQTKTAALFKQLQFSDAELASLLLLSVTSIEIDTEQNTWLLNIQGNLAEDLQKKLTEQLQVKFGVNVQLSGLRIQDSGARSEDSGNICQDKNNICQVSTDSAEEIPLPPEESAPEECIPDELEPVKEESSDFEKAYASLYAPKNKDLILGSIPKGKVRELSTITEEENRVVVEGEFVRTIDKDGELQTFEERELKSGAIMLTFNLADATNGIFVRLRFPLDRVEGDFAVQARKECNEFKRQLKEGMWLRIQGNVAPDKYLNDELVLSAKSILIVPKTERQDKAEQKRVELHCHTKMSRMDGITPVKELVQRAVDWGHPALAITDHGVVQAFPDCQKALSEINDKRKDNNLPPSDLKLIYGMEGYLPNHIIFLVKNITGLRNLYKMVSLSHLRFFHRVPVLPKEIIQEHREGILVGSACEAGELYRAIERGASDEELEQIASFYDYLEIQPLGNNMFMVRSGKHTEKDLQDYNRKIYDLGKKLGKLVVATGDVHFLNPEDAKVRAVLQDAQDYPDADSQAPLYYRTTEEMLKEFEYLGKDIAQEIVVTNPQKIADMVERLKPVPDTDQLYSPHIPGAEDYIRNLAYKTAHELYGDPLPKIVEDRLKMELESIIGHGFAVLYYIAHKLVARSLEINYMVGSRGSVGSSFVATMVNITEVNSLAPHYRCPKCKHTEFFTNGEYASGFDLPVKNCPDCGTEMVRDGHNIPFAVFMGFHGDKVPDIDLNFSEVAQHYAHEYTKELFGKDNVCRAGTIATIANKTAIGFCKGYFEKRNLHAHPAYMASIVQRLQGVKRTTGQHPGGIMVVPRDMDIHYITPMNYPSNERKMKLNILGTYDPPTITTHFDYHSINDRLVKLDILGHDDPGMIRHLEMLIPGLDAKKIPVADPETMAIFTGTQSLGVTPEQIGCDVGTYGIPECGTRFVRQMISDVKPTKFSDVVRISGYSHGTDVWLNNAQDLIKEGKPVTETISTRDDIMTHLIQAGVEPSIAFETMEYVRKGKAADNGLKPKMREAMTAAGIPEWYMKSCETTQYLFPKAHAVAYVMMAYRIAYCKVHYPKEFYAAYFSERADLFDYTIVSKGKEYIKKFIQDTYAQGFKADKVAKASVPYLELVVEMLERGLCFEPIDIYKSHASDFQLTDKGLRPPLVGIPGVGKEAAKLLATAAEKANENNTPFLSREDLADRSGVGRTTVEKLAEIGALGDLPESNAISLFD